MNKDRKTALISYYFNFVFVIGLSNNMLIIAV
jgi:hypothetical protein